jgi:hypothetical protein
MLTFMGTDLGDAEMSDLLEQWGYEPRYFVDDCWVVTARLGTMLRSQH